MKVMFRADASAQIGSGHLMRCFNLALALKERGVETGFICSDRIENLSTWLMSKGINVTVLPKTLELDSVADAELTILSLNLERPDWMVVDHYELNLDWERQLKNFVGRLLVIDDHSGRKHDCDVLLDQNFLQNIERRYSGLVPDACKMLLGPSYALLRKDFPELRKQTTLRQNLEKLLVFFTSGNDQGETLKAMMGINMFGKARHVDVVVGLSNPNNETIKQICLELRWGYHCQVEYMPTLIANADLVVGAGGSSNWERCALGVPALVTVLANNQVAIAEALDKAGVVSNLGWFHTLRPVDYAEALAGLDARRLFDMSSKAFRLVDANGAKRVAETILFS
jgi:UDP-2,4-diacetamido-2,4,6-trideoxy-beta-L-altropyranose hydrolase